MKNVSEKPYTTVEAFYKAVEQLIQALKTKAARPISRWMFLGLFGISNFTTVLLTVLIFSKTELGRLDPSVSTAGWKEATPFSEIGLNTLAAGALSEPVKSPFPQRPLRTLHTAVQRVSKYWFSSSSNSLCKTVRRAGGRSSVAN